MERVFSNGPSKDYVVNPFTALVAGSKEIHIAAPYVTRTEELLNAAKSGTPVELLVGLNASTSPEALWAIHEKPNIEVRYYTHLLHAKIYLFDQAALVGSSNLTDHGLQFNREATIRLEEPDDSETIMELRALFAELWEPTPLLTSEKLRTFTEAHKRFAHANPDALIGAAVGKAEPPSIKVGDTKGKTKRIFLEGLRRQVSEYRKAFNEVTKLFEENQLHRAELEGVASANQTNRFLSWVRRTYAPGEEWESAPARAEDQRRTEILRLGREWTQPDRDTISEDYVVWLRRVRDVFGTTAGIESASKDELTEGLMSLHAFYEQLRFVKGGAANLPTAFWRENDEDDGRVRKTLKYLVHGGGEFVERLHDVLYDPRWKLRSFALSCALELYGTVKPQDFPPVNGRIVKALRYLGFSVRGA